MNLPSLTKSCATVVHNFVTVQSSSACLLSTSAHIHTRTNQLEQISFCSEIHAIQQNGGKGFVDIGEKPNQNWDNLVFISFEIAWKHKIICSIIILFSTYLSRLHNIVPENEEVSRLEIKMTALVYIRLPWCLCTGAK